MEIHEPTYPQNSKRKSALDEFFLSWVTATQKKLGLHIFIFLGLEVASSQ